MVTMSPVHCTVCLRLALEISSLDPSNYLANMNTIILVNILTLHFTISSDSIISMINISEKDIFGWNDDDDEPDLVVKQSSECDGDGESGSDTLVAEDHGGVGGGRGVGGGPEDTRQALQQRGEQDTGPGPGHRPPELTGVMAPAGDHHTEA